MCDYFWQRDQGDLADIVRAGGWVGASSTAFPATASEWQPPSEPMVLPSLSTEELSNNFGDPFANICDPLLNELTSIELFNNKEIRTGQVEVAIESNDGCGGGGGGGGGIISQKLLMGEEIKKPCNIISRVLQVSSGGDKPSPLSPVVAGEMMKVSSGPVGCLADDGGGVQISSARTLGIKRRKNQAKKVVCIPAPAAASSRPSGEVVPSDLWAWRKYGQKPIKGSPYPRGYYRCSSSKGCSARKQVERSRTDPNMLVITYTSEHNHPWPTQRNALAGSTRSQTSKTLSSASKSSTHNLKSLKSLKEEPKETSRSSASLVKEEVAEVDKAIDPAEDNEFDRVLHKSYNPMISKANHPEDFFADFAYLESDSMNLIFSKELIETRLESEYGDKALDPFDMFD